MKSNFYTLLGIIFLFFFCLPFKVFAAVEYNPDAIQVDSLPECTQSVVDFVYSYNNHYYKCVYSSGGLVNLQVGDNLSGQVIYFTFPETQEFMNSISNYVGDSVITFGYIYNSNGWMDVFSIKTLSDSRVALRDDSGVMYYNNVFINGLRSVDSFDFDFSNTDVTDVDLTVSAINVNNPAYQYIGLSSGGSYSYVDQGEIPVLYSYDDKDFYLFYDFGMIANLDIFSNYDFTSFTDYQKVITVIGFNVFYIGILMFFGAVLYKVLARFVRFILG